MNVFINLNNEETKLSYNTSFIKTKGGINIDNNYLKDQDFEKYLKANETNSTLDGNYCYIKKKNDKITISVDHIRSYPLFYSIKDNNLLISDNAQWILNKNPLNKYNNSANTEFWLSGYVLGERTLYYDIKQVLAGGYIKFSYNDNKIKLYKKRFFNYNQIKNNNIELPFLIKNHENAISKSIKKLINRANGRTLVLPLSGGLDSRLIALQLKLHGYKNIICFSYGKPNNKQSRISHKTAKKLGFKWIFVNYDRAHWKKIYKTNQFNKYFYSAGNLNSLSHIQDWLSIKYLTDKKLIPSDSIIVPGHTGDFIATGHIPPNFNRIKSNDQLVKEVIKKHFRVNNYKKLNLLCKNKLKENIIKYSLPNNNIKSSDEAKEAFQYFDWQERQSKFIVNSVRVYEYFNLEWSIPLWDIDVMNFWRKIPFYLKNDKYLYKKYLININDYNVFDDLKSPISEESQKINIIKIPFRKLKEKIKTTSTSFKKRFLFYFIHEFQWYGIFSYWRIISSRNKLQNINTLLAEDYLDNIKNENSIYNKLL